MNIRIALAGNPNSGKTTLFNALTGSNQYVGNWPGVTVEKKEGKLKKHDGVIVTDLPGIYSLSPYTPEEMVARNYLVGERPEVILNIIDGTNLERNLYLTTQLTELGIPVVIAINMMDVVRKNGDSLDIQLLSQRLGCKIIPISALKGDGVMEAAEEALKAAFNEKTVPSHSFSGAVEHALAHIEEAAVHGLPEEQQRWYAIKIFERDEKVLSQLQLPAEKMAHIEQDIRAAELELDDDAESIITNERYLYIDRILKPCFKRKAEGKLTTSDKIDRVLTNRFAALPIFAVIMFLVYYISVSTVGTLVTDWTNDGVFGEGWRLLGVGTEEYEADASSVAAVDELIARAEALGIDTSEYTEAVEAGNAGAARTAVSAILAAFPRSTDVDVDDDGQNDPYLWAYEDEETYQTAYMTSPQMEEAIALAYHTGFTEPDPSDYGIWIPGVPVLIGQGLEAAQTPAWLNSVILDGIIGGVGAVLGFVPQILVLFTLLAFLESCGY